MLFIWVVCILFGLGIWLFWWMWFYCLRCFCCLVWFCGRILFWWRCWWCLVFVVCVVWLFVWWVLRLWFGWLNSFVCYRKCWWFWCCFWIMWFVVWFCCCRLGLCDIFGCWMVFVVFDVVDVCSDWGLCFDRFVLDVMLCFFKEMLGLLYVGY